MIIYTLLIITIALFLFKIYNKLSAGQNNSYTCLIDKTAIVTGSNTGIGFVTALDFAKRGARVILACRDLNTAEEARKNIIKQTDNCNVYVKHLDLSSLKSVKRFANDIVQSKEKVHILVNNAGAAGFGDVRTEDNLQILMQVNYFGSFLLTYLLLDVIKESAPSRIVNVSSGVANYAKLTADKIDSYPTGNTFSPEWQLYNNSKLCNLLFTIKLAELLNGTGVTVNALHPGCIDTDFIRRAPAHIKLPLKFLLSNFLKNADEGAQTSIYLGVSKEVDNVSGCFFQDCQKIPFYKTVNKQLTEEVWMKTIELLAERDYKTFE